MGAVMLLCLWRPAMGPPMPRTAWAARFGALARLWDIGLLILLVVGGISLGWFSPTEAASVGCVGALALCAWRGKLGWASLRKAAVETLKTTGMIYFVVIGAIVFSTFVAAAGVAHQVSSLVGLMHADKLAIVTVMVLIILALGMFLDGLALMTLVTPIFLPITLSLGISPIWFGVILVRAMEIGFVHPPVGMNVYIIHGLAKDIPLGTIFKGIVPFLLTDALHLAFLILVPASVLYLPELLHA
jgi:tripartite ATP-independent transporter DctM subunit